MAKIGGNFIQENGVDFFWGPLQKINLN